MRRPDTSFRLLITGLVLGLLLMVLGGEGQTAAAQQPAFDSDQPIQSLEQAAVNVDSDSKLVTLATALQKARADTEISHQEYRDGVRVFRQHHPGFYGNFFGDPFYATYDARYVRLTWERQLAEPDINPQNSFRSNSWFFCAPSSYDPAFNGRCLGFAFSASDFFFLPSGPAFGHRKLASRQDRAPVRSASRDIASQIPSVNSASSEPDTSRMPIADVPTPDRPESGRSVPDEIETTPPVESDAGLAPASDEISVPDKITAPERKIESEREARTATDRLETISRIRALVRRQQNGGQLSTTERREVMSTLRRMAQRKNAGVEGPNSGRIERLRQHARSLTDRNHEFADPPQAHDRTGIDRSDPGTVRSDRPDAESDKSSSRDRSSDDETEN